MGSVVTLLGHLKYYGPLVSASSSLENDNSRIYFREFLLVALGALAPTIKCSTSEVAAFMAACMNQISDLNAMSEASFKAPGETIKTQVWDYLAKNGSWVVSLGRAASSFLQSTGQESKTARLLIRCGERHGKDFFCPSSNPRPRLFGFCNPYVLLQLLPNSNLRVQLLRRLVARVYRGTGELLIRYKADCGPLDEQPADDISAVVWEFATALPLDRTSSKRDREDNIKSLTRHKRWVQLDVFKNSLPCLCRTSCFDCPVLGLLQVSLSSWSRMLWLQYRT